MAVAGCSESSSAAPSVGANPSVSATQAAAGTAQPPSSVPSVGTASWVVTDLPLPDGTPACAADEGGLQNLQVVAFGSGLVALGSCAHSASASLVWVSADGDTWQAAAPATLTHADVYELVAADGLLVAGGQDTTNGFNAASWTSRDGLSWTRSTGDLACGVISTIAKAGAQFVAFGNKVPNAPEVEVPPGICQWTSSDGLIWKPVDLPAAVFPATAAVFSVAVGQSGLVAIGTQSGPSPSVVVWRSPDGRTWTRGGSSAMADWSSLDVAIAGGPGLVVLGGDANGNESLSTSADGVAWTTTAAPGQGALYGGPALALGSAGFIFGGVSVNGAPGPAMAWTSADASTWLPTPALPDGLSYDSVAGAGSTFVLAASTADGHAAILTLQR